RLAASQFNVYYSLNDFPDEITYSVMMILDERGSEYTGKKGAAESLPLHMENLMKQMMIRGKKDTGRNDLYPSLITFDSTYRLKKSPLAFAPSLHILSYIESGVAQQLRLLVHLRDKKSGQAARIYNV